MYAHGDKEIHNLHAFTYIARQMPEGSFFKVL
jgi:hypothetical protein